MSYSKHLEIRANKIGHGLFTTVSIPSNTPIIEALGKVLTTNELPDPNNQNLLQVGPNTFMCSTGHLVPDHIHHSCDPNCYFHVVGNRAILFSMYLIPTNSELTFDYSTTSTESKKQWNMKCNCESFKCRKEISGFQYLDESTQMFYKNKGILPIYITLPIIQPR